MCDVQAVERPALRVIIAAASPAGSSLPPIDTAAEARRLRDALQDLPAIILDGQEGRPGATLAAIAAELRDDADVVVLVCHGALVNGQPFLWLEQPGPRYKPVPGAELVELIAQLARRPLLVVLAACRGAGDNFEVWGAVGPQLARAGVASVLAMQGDIPVLTAQLLLPTFFRELRRDGVIDRALAAARAELGPSHPWWMPVLWSRVRDGRLWREPAPLQRLSQHLTRMALDELRDQVLLTMQAYELHLRTAPRRADSMAAQPYKFLYSFELEDASRFFGRDHSLQTLISHVRSSRLTVLQAPSGTGKSSLLKAGLIPRLLDASMLTVVTRAGNDPIAALKRALLPSAHVVPAALLDAISLAELLGIVWAAIAHRFQALVLVVDQFEELFVATPDPTGRHTVAAELARCLEDTAVPLRLVLSIRSDFFAELTHFQPRIPGIYHSVLRLEPLRRQEALDAIIEPLRRLDPPRVYRPELLERLLDDLDRSGVEPPQLQIVCTRLFERLQLGEVELGLSHYAALGGTEGVLRDYLRESLARLGGLAPLGRSILTALVSPEGARQILSEDQLRADLPGPVDPANLAAVLATLVADRLLRRDEQDGQWRYELAHDYMLVEVRTWMIQDDAALRLARDSLRQGVARWRRHGWLLDTREQELIAGQPDLLTQLRPAEAELLLRSSLAAGAPVEPWATAAARLGADLWEIIRPLLQQEELGVRAQALAALPALGDAALPELRAALADPLPHIRTCAITALERLGTEGAKALLAQELRWEAPIPLSDGQRLYVDRGPVTCAEYELFLSMVDVHASPEGWGESWAPRGAGHLPVTGVSWDDATAYARWAGRRLLSHAEWVLAAGGRDSYPWGPHFSAERCNTRESGNGAPTPVGSYAPAGDSPYGISDMAGNVWEWLATHDADATTLRHLAGGAWGYSALYARIDAGGIWRDASVRQPDIGFRLCFEVTLTEETP